MMILSTLDELSDELFNLGIGLVTNTGLAGNPEVEGIADRLAEISDELIVIAAQHRTPRPRRQRGSVALQS